MGPTPKLPAPSKSIIPTVNVAAAKPWPQGTAPTAAANLSVTAFAVGLDHPRWLYVLPNGDVLVAETNAPPKPEDGKGIKGWFMKKAMNKAGASTPSANRITLLRDADGDGVAEIHTAFLSGLHSPFGMALVGEDFYVANSDGVVRVPYQERRDADRGARRPQSLNLPAGPLNHHWTKNIIASGDGTHLYATVGSNSNVAENGMEKEEGRAAIWEIDRQSGKHRIFASGLRNPNGLAWEPHTGTLWTVVNERDELGSDLVPDYLTSVHDGAFYGWPYSYYGQHIDSRVTPPPAGPGRQGRSCRTMPSGRTLLRWGWRTPTANRLPQDFQRGHVHRPARLLESRAAKRLQGDLRAVLGRQAVRTLRGRPDRISERKGGGARAARWAWRSTAHGALLVADDVGNTVWRVTSAPLMGRACRKQLGYRPLCQRKRS